MRDILENHWLRATTQDLDDEYEDFLINDYRELSERDSQLMADEYVRAVTMTMTSPPSDKFQDKFRDSREHAEMTFYDNLGMEESTNTATTTIKDKVSEALKAKYEYIDSIVIDELSSEELVKFKLSLKELAKDFIK